MSTKDFITKSNILLLWEIISENEYIKNNPIELNNVNEFMNRIIPQFFEAERKTLPDLISMNKKFLQYMYSIIQKQISSTQKKELITNAEIKEKRLNQFDSDLSRAQQEFKNSMSLPVPDTPNFTDKLDEPMDEMDTTVKRMIAQRNMDLNQMYNSQYKVSDVDNWLKSSETSVKKDKNQEKYNTNKVKYIKIDEEIDKSVLSNVVIDLDERVKQFEETNNKINKKQVGFNNDVEIREISEPDTQIGIGNIFSKLKKLDNNVNATATSTTSATTTTTSATSANKETKPHTDISQPIKNNLVDEEKTNNINERLDLIEKQIKGLSNTLESHMEKCNSTLTILYSLLMKQDKELEEKKLIEQRNKELVRPENPNSHMIVDY